MVEGPGRAEKGYTPSDLLLPDRPASLSLSSTLWYGSQWGQSPSHPTICPGPNLCILEHLRISLSTCFKGYVRSKSCSSPRWACPLKDDFVPFRLQRKRMASQKVNKTKQKNQVCKGKQSCVVLEKSHGKKGIFNEIFSIRHLCPSIVSLNPIPHWSDYTVTCPHLAYCVCDLFQVVQNWERELIWFSLTEPRNCLLIGFFSFLFQIPPTYLADECVTRSEQGGLAVLIHLIQESGQVLTSGM